MDLHHPLTHGSEATGNSLVQTHQVLPQTSDLPTLAPQLLPLLQQLAPVLQQLLPLLQLSLAQSVEGLGMGTQFSPHLGNITIGAARQHPGRSRISGGDRNLLTQPGHLAFQDCQASLDVVSRTVTHTRSLADLTKHLVGLPRCRDRPARR